MKKNVSIFDEDFKKNYDKDSNKGYTLEADIEYPKNFPNLYCDLPFSSERERK